MQAQDTTTLFLLKLWPWVEANKKRLIAGMAIVLIAIFLYSFFSWQGRQKEIAAGQEMSQVLLAGSGPSAAAFLKIAEQHPGTIAGQRALLQGAAVLFDTGKFADAQTQFQKFLDAHSDSEFSGQAALGVAASLDAQGKSDQAVGAYQRVINSSSDVMIVNAAKFGLGRIDESQGKFNDAMGFYQDIVRANPGGSMSSEATMRMMQLRTKLPAPAPATNPPAPLLKSAPLK